MARRTRTEVAGGLYHVITRGNNRQPIFNSPTDYEKFLSLLAVQKRKLPFFLYAYCLMPNHVHLLIERQAATIGQIMHRMLTDYSQHYNRRYLRVGCLLHSRHKSILCRVLIFPVCIALVSYSSASAQTAETKYRTDEELREDLKLGPCKNSERLEGVKKFFHQMGAAESDISAERIKDVQNVIITKKGKTDETVIVGAHYDKVSDGCGTIDNWTGIVILGNLYRTLREFDTEKTYLFVAFDKEEIGLVGSAAMAKSIPKEKRASYCSMINLDSFGFSYPQVLANASTSKMTAVAKDLAAEIKMPFSNASLGGVADADSSSFWLKAYRRSPFMASRTSGSNTSTRPTTNWRTLT